MYNINVSKCFEIPYVNLEILKYLSYYDLFKFMKTNCIFDNLVNNNSELLITNIIKDHLNMNLTIRKNSISIQKNNNCISFCITNQNWFYIIKQIIYYSLDSS